MKFENSWGKRYGLQNSGMTTKQDIWMEIKALIEENTINLGIKKYSSNFGINYMF